MRLERTVAGWRFEIAYERLKNNKYAVGAVYYVSRGWHWPGHWGTQTRVGRRQFTAIIERADLEKT